MITIYTGSQSGIGMPVSWSAVVPATAVRTLPTTGGVSAAVGTKRRFVDVAHVCAFPATADALDATFPGNSAWSPPI